MLLCFRSTHLLLFSLMCAIGAQSSTKYVKVDYKFGKGSCGLPWIWDAVYHPFKQKLEVLLIPHTACYYNATELSGLLRASPGYESYFPFLTRNMSAPFCERKQELHRRLLGKTILGVYKTTSDNDKNAEKEVLKKINSKVIRGSRGLAFMAPLRIEFSPISRIDTSASFDIIIPKQLLLNYNRGISLTNIPIRVSADSPKAYGISMCTVTTNRNRRELVEWIEYHRHLGVQHFYLYDTLSARSRSHLSNSSSQGSFLAKLLADYVRSQVVSVTSWQHSNCMPDVHVCRIACSYKYNATSRQDEHDTCFAPPSCINHIGALGSCYMRHRHSSQHMITIDDDEFIHLHPSYFLPRRASAHAAGSAVLTPLQRYIANVRSLYGDDMTVRGIALYPQLLTPCNYTGKAQRTRSLLPRLDHEKFGLMPGSTHEIKWILNTDMVEMLTVHYLTEKTHMPYKRARLVVDHRANYSTEAFLYHYKNFSSNTLFDLSYNPPSLTDYSWREQLVCRLATDWNVLRNHVAEANASRSHHEDQSDFMDEVRQRYRSAMHV